MVLIINVCINLGFLCAIVTFCIYKISILNIHFAHTVILIIETSSDCHDPHTKSALLTRDCMNVEHNFIHPIAPIASPAQQNTSRVL